MIIIADGGSTKTGWCLVDKEGNRNYFHTEGYNPYFVDSAYIRQSIQGSLPAALNPRKVTAVYFMAQAAHQINLSWWKMR